MLEYEIVLLQFLEFASDSPADLSGFFPIQEIGVVTLSLNVSLDLGSIVGRDTTQLYQVHTEQSHVADMVTGSLLDTWTQVDSRYV